MGGIDGSRRARIAMPIETGSSVTAKTCSAVRRKGRLSGSSRVSRPPPSRLTPRSIQKGMVAKQRTLESAVRVRESATFAPAR